MMTLSQFLISSAGILLVLTAGTDAYLLTATATPQPEFMQQPDSIGPSSVSQFSCHSLGSGDTVCVSNHGNISKFNSPVGSEHIASGYIGEGYALCDSNGVKGYDAGADENGFGPPAISQSHGPNTLPLSISRDTTDGVLRLYQDYGRPDTREKDFSIKMTVLNLSRVTVTGVQLVRYFDGDIDGDSGDDRYAQTLDSVWGWDDTSGHGLMLTAQSLGVTHFMAAEPFSSWDPARGGLATHCDIGGLTTPLGPGDFVGAVIYSLGTLGPGKRKVVTVNYQRF